MTNQRLEPVRKIPRISSRALAIVAVLAAALLVLASLVGAFSGSAARADRAPALAAASLPAESKTAAAETPAATASSAESAPPQDEQEAAAGAVCTFPGGVLPADLPLYVDQAAPWDPVCWLGGAARSFRVHSFGDAVGWAEPGRTVYICPGHYPAAGAYSSQLKVVPSTNTAICPTGPAVLKAFPSLEGKVDSQCPWGQANCNACVNNLVQQFELLPTISSQLEFRLADHPVPGWNGDLEFRGHWQGIQRIMPGGGQFLIVSRDNITRTVGGPFYSGFAIVEMGSQSDTIGYPFWSRYRSGAIPPPWDRVVETFTIDREHIHPGGIQVSGNILAVSLEPENAAYDPPIVRLYRLKDPTNPTDVVLSHSLGTYADGNKGSFAGLTQLSDGRYLLLTGRSGGSFPIDFYVSDSPNSLKDFSFMYRWPGTNEAGGRLSPKEAVINEPNADAFPHGWDAYQSMNLVTDCDGTIYLIGTGNRQDTTNTCVPDIDWLPFPLPYAGFCLPNGEDWADLYRLDISADGNGVDLVKVASRHFFTRGSYGNFDAGAGVYVDPENRLYLYASEHGAEGPWNVQTGHTVRFTQFGPTSLDIGRPRPPLLLSSNKAVLLKWDPKSATELQFVYVLMSFLLEGDYQQVTGVPLDADAYQHYPSIEFDPQAGAAQAAAPAPGTTLYYKVVAVDGQGNESLPSEVVSTTFGLLTLFAPDSYGPSGGSVSVPVNIANAEGLNICRADIRLSYDPAVLAPTGVESSALTAAYNWSSQVITPGLIQATISDTNGETLRGRGSLFDLLFDVTGAAGAGSQIAFDAAGSTIVDCDTLSATLSLDLSATAAFTVQAAYARGDVNGDGLVEGADAALALDFATGVLEPSPTELSAGDLDGDQRFSAADALLIMRHIAALPMLPSGANPALPAAVTLSAAEGVSLAQGDSAWAPIAIDDAGGLAGADITLNYDPSVVTPVEARTTTLSAGFDLAYHIPAPGQLRLSLKPRSGQEDGLAGGSGPLVEVLFEDQALSQGGAPSLLNLVAAHLYDRYGRDFATSALLIPVGMVDGSIMVQDALAPYVTDVFPGDGLSEVRLTSPIHIAFSEAISPASLALEMSPALNVTRTWNESGWLLTLAHDGLAPETTYELSISASDMAGAPMTQTITWAFTTTVLDLTPPLVLSVSPADSTPEVPLDAPIVIRFSEEVLVPSLDLSISPFPDGWDMAWNLERTVVTATHVSFWPASAYTITVTADDWAGNPMAEPFSWHFATAAAVQQYQAFLPLVITRP